MLDGFIFYFKKKIFGQISSIWKLGRIVEEVPVMFWDALCERYRYLCLKNPLGLSNLFRETLVLSNVWVSSPRMQQGLNHSWWFHFNILQIEDIWRNIFYLIFMGKSLKDGASTWSVSRTKKHCPFLERPPSIGSLCFSVGVRAFVDKLPEWVWGRCEWARWFHINGFTASWTVASWIEEVLGNQLYRIKQNKGKHGIAAFVSRMLVDKYKDTYPHI